MTKYSPFNSRFLPNTQVVEERDGNISKYPHTDQLPRLLRALNYEFSVGLPDKIARVDHRAKDYMKIQKYLAVRIFCTMINEARRDNLQLCTLMDRNLVARISIVQHITEHVAPASVHRFKFYGGDDFFTHIYVNGKQVAFANHAIERFSERVPDHTGADLTRLLDSFFGSPIIVMECNNSPAFVIPYDKSVIAFPIRQSDNTAEYFLPTCLSGDEISQLNPIFPPPAYPSLYEAIYREPAVRNWDPILHGMRLKHSWQHKKPLTAPQYFKMAKHPWSKTGHLLDEICNIQGHGEGSRLLFIDNIPGHHFLTLLPGIRSIKFKGNIMTFSDAGCDYAVQELARGDYDGDGYEDALVLISTNYQGGSGRFNQAYLVSKTGPKQRQLKLTKMDAVLQSTTDRAIITRRN